MQVTEKIATEEVNNWLDHKKIKTKKRTASKEHIDSLIDAICEGNLILNADFTLTQKLDFPIGADSKINTITYVPRLDVETRKSHLAGVKSSEGGDGFIVAIISAITNIPKAVIDKMDSEDYRVASSIAVFFM